MKRLISTLCLALLPVGCFGACGGSEAASSSEHASSQTTTTTTTTTTTGSDTTTNEPTPATHGELVVGTDACTTDADCVPGGCCHPATCVARASAPACGESVCTSDCRYGTLDCGGSCLCHEGHCAAQLSAPPIIPGVTDVQ